MKKDIHPEYRNVIFKDVSTDFAILTRSTVQTSETMKWEDGKEYPLYKVDISSASHPFYTGKQKIIDTEGRIEKFQRNLEAATLISKVLRNNKAENKIQFFNKLKKIPFNLKRDFFLPNFQSLRSLHANFELKPLLFYLKR